MEYIKIIDELLERGRISKTNHVNLKKIQRPTKLNS